MATPSSEAIGATSELLRIRLMSALNNLPVTISRPEAASGGQRSLNLFLYGVAIDPQLRNEPLDRGQVPPLWVSLHYLMTAFDDSGESDSVAAHRLLGQGMTVLQGLNFMRPATTNLALAKNPEPLKLSFDDANVDLLSKLMQGSEEKFRISVALQVRPVMLELDAPPAWSPLVKTIGPPAAPGIVVLPSLGAVLDAIEPARFVAGTSVTLRGTDLAGYDEVLLGSDSLPLVPGPEGSASFTVPAAAPIAANGYGLCIARTLPSGRKITSNALLAELLPVVAGAALSGALTILPPPGPSALRHGSFRVTGAQLGGGTASAFATLFKDGSAHGLFEAGAASTMTQLDFTVPPAAALPPGVYAVVVRVNGQQAIDSPLLNWV
ncbi:MAG: DUF4255 domain-containing protein [Caldimonas sp.]